MGDIVYPGVMLTRLSRTIRREDVEDFVFSKIGTSPNLYRNGKPEVIIYRPLEQTEKTTEMPATFQAVRALINGISLPLDEIRQIFGSNLLNGQQVFIQTPDMGVPRKTNGELYTERKFLHNHLVEGQGNMIPIPILNATVDRKLGKITSLKSTVLYEDTKQFVKIDELRNSGKIILYGNTDRGCFNEAKSYSRMEIVFQNRMDAMQAICRLNLNASFSTRGKPSYFRLDENTPRCTLTLMSGLGLGGSILNVKMLMKCHGYVPLDALNTDVFNITGLRRMNQFCVECNAKYVILGVGSNLDWLAAKCECPTFQSPFTWNDEDFFRIRYWPSNTDKPALRISRGLIPLYNDVQEFIQTGFAAFLNEFLAQKEQLELTETHGVVSVEEIVEVVTTNSVKHTMQMLRLVVPRTKFWSQGGCNSFKNAKLLRRDGQDWKHSVVGIQSTLYEINALPTISLSEVVLVADLLPQQSKFEVGEEVSIMPLPLQTENKSLKKALDIWKNYVRVLKQPDHYLQATLSSYVRCKNSKTNEAIKGKGFFCEHFAWQFVIKTKISPTWELLSQLLDTCYLGINIIITLNDRHSRKCAARITGIYACEGDYVEIETILFLNFAKIRNVSNVLDYQPWIISKPVQDVHEKLFYLVQNDADTSVLSSSQVAVFDDSYIEVGSIEDLSSVISLWRQRPTPNFPLLDLLMHPRNPDACSRRFDPLELPRSKFNSEVLTMLNYLNKSQRIAVERCFGNMLSIMQGPPGTGKTSTIAVGVLALQALSGGIVIACCQSNYATNVLLEATIKRNQASFKSPKAIVRMLSFSQEHLLTSIENQSSNNHDQYQLHVKVRDHPKWKDNAEITDIISKKKLLGEALLTIEERSKLSDFVSEITTEILASADLVLCTVKCLSDGRMQSALREARTRGRKLVGMVVDEASLLTVPSVLPLLLLKPLRLWLVGDDSQLSPTVRNEASRVSCLDVSWFEFLRLTPYGKKPGCVSLLDIQYRMPSPSAQLISTFMYHDLLQSDDSVRNRDYTGDIFKTSFPQLQNVHSAWFSYDAYGELRDEGSVSYYNIIEVNIIKNILLKLHKAKESMRTVTIIAMYENQVERVKDMVNCMGRDFEEVIVCTVDASQGKENEIVILSTVRSNMDNSVGFLSDRRRLNVALSRHRKCLFIVGDLLCLMRSTSLDLQKIITILAKQKVKVTLFSSDASLSVAELYTEEIATNLSRLNLGL